MQEGRRSQWASAGRSGRAGERRCRRRWGQGLLPSAVLLLAAGACASSRKAVERLRSGCGSRGGVGEQSCEQRRCLQRVALLACVELADQVHGCQHSKSRFLLSLGSGCARKAICTYGIVSSPARSRNSQVPSAPNSQTPPLRGGTS